jgi:biopolymer transport protein TolR
MASTTIGPSSTGRGKPLNVEYNLVPFIDLLSCLIAFLLMTAVWTQISMLQTNEGTSDTPSNKQDVTLAVYLFKDYQEINVGNRTIPVPKRGKEYDQERLAAELFTLKKSYPNKKDILILSQDKVLYKDVIATMDTVIGADLPNITVSGMLEE